MWTATNIVGWDEVSLEASTYDREISAPSLRSLAEEMNRDIGGDAGSWPVKDVVVTDSVMLVTCRTDRGHLATITAQIKEV
jgi:hypothetical protein